MSRIMFLSLLAGLFLLMFAAGLLTGRTMPRPASRTAQIQVCAYSDNGQVYLYTAAHC